MNNRAIVPSNSSSRNIQREHFRTIMTRKGIKKIQINKDNKKAPSMQKNLSAKKINMHNTSVTPTPLPRKEILLKPRDESKSDWKSVLKLDMGPTELEKKKRDIEKEMQEKGIKLLDGESVGLEVMGLGSSGYMSTMGSVTFLDKDSGENSLMMDWRMSSGSLIEWLYEQKEEGNPVIYKMDDMGMLEYARPFEAIDTENPNKGRSAYYESVENHGDYYLLRRINSQGKTVRSKKFKNFESYLKAKQESELRGLDLFGLRLDPQMRLKEFKE